MCPLTKRIGQAFAFKTCDGAFETLIELFKHLGEHLKHSAESLKARPCVCVITQPMLSQSAMVSNKGEHATHVST